MGTWVRTDLLRQAEVDSWVAQLVDSSPQEQLSELAELEASLQARVLQLLHPRRWPVGEQPTGGWPRPERLQGDDLVAPLAEGRARWLAPDVIVYDYASWTHASE